MVMTDSTPALRRPRSDVFGIADLVDLAARGKLRVPTFQRPFVWDETDVRRLFDSIWRGFPIGTLLLWSRPAPSGEVKFGPVNFKVDQTEDAYWIVDGQQRVTTLIGALADTDNSEPLFDICFDLRRARFVHGGKRPLPSSWLPLRVTLESRTLLAWLHAHGDQLEADELDRADELAGALRDYKFSAYIVEHDDEQLLRDVFDRVNSAGKPISRAQVFHALFGGDSAAASTQSVIAALEREHFGTLGDQRVVQTLLAIRGGDVARDLHEEFSADEDRDLAFDDTERALARTFTFLRSQGVPHLQVVPSEFAIPVLGAFFHLHPDPEPWVERLLARWVWRGWTHGYGRSGQTPALRQAVRAVNPIKNDSDAAPTAFNAVKSLLDAVQDDEPPPINVEGFRTDSAAGRLALLALASLRPRRADETEIDLTAVLAAHGADAITELVSGNRSNLAARGFWPIGDQPHGTESPEVLASHAIDTDAAAALRHGDTRRFIARRSALVSDLTVQFVRSRIEPGAITQTTFEPTLRSRRGFRCFEGGVMPGSAEALVVQLFDPSGGWVSVGHITHANERSTFRSFDSYWNLGHRPVLGQVFEENGPSWSPTSRIRLPKWFSHVLPEGRLREAIADAADVKAVREFFLLRRIGGDDLPGGIRVVEEATADDDGSGTEEAPPPQVVVGDLGPFKFSLAGIQLKFSVRDTDRGLTVPATGEAGDWIAKLPDPRQGFEGVPEAELAGLELARAAGIRVPRARLVDVNQIARIPEWATVGGGQALLVERYDRTADGGRVHTEELAQVLDLPTGHHSYKYEFTNFETVART